MAHSEQLQFINSIKQVFPFYFTGSRVLEVGSLDINGSIRTYFSDCEYLGIDIAAGRGVDLICEGQLLGLPTASFDTVLSCEAMEHNPFWVETLANMFRLCAPGGMVVMTCASEGRPEHGTSRTTPNSSPLTVAKNWDYYRNLTPKMLESALPLERWFEDYWIGVNWNSCDLYFIGFRADVRKRQSIKNLAPLLEDLCRSRNQLHTMKIKLLTFFLGDQLLHQYRYYRTTRQRS